MLIINDLGDGTVGATLGLGWSVGTATYMQVSVAWVVYTLLVQGNLYHQTSIECVAETLQLSAIGNLCLINMRV